MASFPLALPLPKQPLHSHTHEPSPAQTSHITIPSPYRHPSRHPSISVPPSFPPLFTSTTFALPLPPLCGAVACLLEYLGALWKSLWQILNLAMTRLTSLHVLASFDRWMSGRAYLRTCIILWRLRYRRLEWVLWWDVGWEDLGPVNRYKDQETLVWMRRVMAKELTIMVIRKHLQGLDSESKCVFEFSRSWCRYSRNWKFWYVGYVQMETQ